MSSSRSAFSAIAIILLMVAAPWAAADTSTWIGPSAVGSSGQAVTVDGWNVPGNATILDSWMTVEDIMAADGNGSQWRTGTSTNFTTGSFTDTTESHFAGQLSLLPDGAFSQVDNFGGNVTLTFQSNWSVDGNSGIWHPSLIGNIQNGTVSGGTRTLTHGSIPASAHSGSVVAATVAGSPVPAGIDSALRMPAENIPWPVANFNMTMWHWHHLDSNSGDAVWVEYRLDTGSWTWIAPVGGYNGNVTLTNSIPSGTPGSSSSFPAWASNSHTGWNIDTFSLDNITGLSTANQIQFRFRIFTDNSSSGIPGWFLDDIRLVNIGNSTDYWHHGCYTTSATSCFYSNSAEGALQGNFNFSNASTNSVLRTRLEWDLEGSGWDNLCIELSTNNNTWTDISSTGGSQSTTVCRSRSGAIPSSGYTVGGTTYTDQTNSFVLLDLAIPAAFQGVNLVNVRYLVQTDSSVAYGGNTDPLEGVTLDYIEIIDSSGNVVDSDQLNTAGTMFHYALGAVADDWQFISIGAGALTTGQDFEDASAGAPGGIPNGWAATGEWEFGPLNTNQMGPTSFPTTPFGFGTNLAGTYSGSNWDHLYTPGYSIPAGASARLTFGHWMCSESNYDGGAIFISTDNTTWNHFDPGGAAFYDVNGLPFNANANLASEWIFDGSNAIPQGGFSCNGPHNLWETKTADLSSYSGQTVWFRFSFESDSIVNDEGWYVDDVGLEVDYFLDEGNWLSPPIQVADLGAGFVDVDATMGNGTWIGGAIVDSTGSPIVGFENQTLPISLHGLDRDAHSSIHVRVTMGTSDPYSTPLVSALHVGSVRYLDGNGPEKTGWLVGSGLVSGDGNLTNPGTSSEVVMSNFVHSSRPITSVRFSGVATGVTINLIDSWGNYIGSTGPTGTLTFPEPQPGFGVRVNVAGGGMVRELAAIGLFGQPAVNATIDVTDDGTVDWSFPSGTAYGYHGWQTKLYQTTDSSGTTTHNGSTSARVTVDSTSPAAISVMIPGEATVTSLVVSMVAATGTFVSQGVEFNQVGSSQVVSFTGSGVSTYSFSNTWHNQMNAIQPQSGIQVDRDWRVIEFEISGTAPDIIDITAFTVGYSISENVTGLTQQVKDYHADEQIGAPKLQITVPVTMTADIGVLVIGGGIYHELMITNHQFTAPNTMYPDGTSVTISTGHHHLYDNDEIGQIQLVGTGSENTSIVFTVTNGDGQWATPTFAQAAGQSCLTLDSANSLAIVTQSNPPGQLFDFIAVDWIFDVQWSCDDIASITWKATAFNTTGESSSPAYAQSGGSGSQAIENDLEISGFEVYDVHGRHLSNPFSPDYPFRVIPEATLNISGQVRFQNTVDLRPATSDFAVGLNISGVEIPLLSDGPGSFSGQATLGSDDAYTLSPIMGRVGPVTGSTGAGDMTVQPPVVIVLIDDSPPIAGPLLVQTSVGLLDADGFVWDPISPLSVYVTVEDAEDRGDSLTLHYWRQNIDDTNADGLADESEYQSLTSSLFELRSGSEQVTFSGIDVSGNGFNGKVSLYLSGTDWAGNSYLDGGTGGGAGLSNDWATLQTAENTETILLGTGFSLDTESEYLLAGQEHTISMYIQDANGIETLDDIVVYLAGQTSAPFGEFHYDPRQGTFFAPFESHVTPIGVTIEQLSEDTAKVDLRFSLDWHSPTSENFRIPGVTIIDDQQVVENVNNLNGMRWKLDNGLEAITTDLIDMTPPISPSDTSILYVRQGDELAVEGIVRYVETQIPVLEPTTNLEVEGVIMYGITELSANVSVQPGGVFSLPFVLPMRAPLNPNMPIHIYVRNVEGSGTSVLNTDTSIVVDSDAPVISFDVYRYPTTSLTLLESDRLDNVTINFVVEDNGGMADTPLTLHWAYLRNGLPLMGASNSAEIPRVFVEDSVYHYHGIFDLRAQGIDRLEDGDQITLWVSGEDLAGNELVGEGTQSLPRVPSLSIIEFVPSLIDFTIEPAHPVVGEMVTITAYFDNDGLRNGTLSVTLAERIDGLWKEYDTVEVSMGPMSRDNTATFTWEAWQAGTADLHLIVDGNHSVLLSVDSFEIAASDGSGGFAGMSLAMIIGLIVILVIAVLSLVLVLVLRRPQDDDYEWVEDDEWFDDDGHPAPAGPTGPPADAPPMPSMDAKPIPSPPPTTEFPLDYNDATVSYVMSQHGITEGDAFLSFAAAYDADDNGYLRQSELVEAAKAFAAMSDEGDELSSAVAEVKAGLPEWSDKRIRKWLQRGWKPHQIVAEHASSAPPPPPSEEGDERDMDAELEVEAEPVVEAAVEPEVQEEPEPVVEAEPESELESEVELPSKAALNRMKKAELIELADSLGFDTDGTKADIISRLLGS